MGTGIRYQVRNVLTILAIVGETKSKFAHLLLSHLSVVAPFYFVSFSIYQTDLSKRGGIQSDDVVYHQGSCTPRIEMTAILAGLQLILVARQHSCVAVGSLILVFQPTPNYT